MICYGNLCPAMSTWHFPAGVAKALFFVSSDDTDPTCPAPMLRRCLARLRLCCTRLRPPLLLRADAPAEPLPNPGRITLSLGQQLRDDEAVVVAAARRWGQRHISVDRGLLLAALGPTASVTACIDGICVVTGVYVVDVQHRPDGSLKALRGTLSCYHAIPYVDCGYWAKYARNGDEVLVDPAAIRRVELPPLTLLDL